MSTQNASRRFASITIGDSAATWRDVSEENVVRFAEITGDRNPIHLDAEHAAQTPFKERIAHGILTAGHISAVLGMLLPGPGAIYVSQTLNFKRPVRIGDSVLTKVKVTGKDDAKRRVTLQCICMVGDTEVLTGEAVLQLSV